MTKSFRITVLIALLALSTCTAAFATFPTVEYMGFEQASWTYTYKVTQWLTCENAFDDFEIDMYLPVGTAYTASGPFVGTPSGTSLNWAIHDGYVVNSGFMGVEWMGNEETVVWPGNALEEPWVGYFKLQVPNSAPITGPLGDAVTRWVGTIESEHSTMGITVPGPVPEPSSLIALGGLCAGLLPMVVRRRGR